MNSPGYRAVVLNGEGSLTMPEDTLDGHTLGDGGGGPDIEGLGLLLNLLQCTGQPPSTENYQKSLFKHANGAKAEKALSQTAWLDCRLYLEQPTCLLAASISSALK